MPGPSGGGNTTQETRPWSQQQRDALIAGYNQLIPQILNRPLDYYPGSTVAPRSADTMAGMAGIRTAATQGGLDPFAQQLARNTLSGQYVGQRPQALTNVIQGDLTAYSPEALRQTASGQFLQPNPFMQAALQPAFNQARQTFQTGTVPTTDSEFARAGRFGGGAHGNASQANADAFAQALTNTGGQLAYQNYGDERGRQMQALGMDQARREAGLGRQMQGIGLDQQRLDAERNRQMQVLGMSPQLDAQRYAGAQRLLGLGQMGDQRLQSQLQDDVNRFNFYQNEPVQRLSDLFNLAGMNTGNMVSQSGGGSSPLAGAIGGGLGGLGLAAALGLTNPFAVAGMGGLGALGGLFG